MPHYWDSLTVECRRAILLHELSHITQKDHWISVVQMFAQSLYFFNPLVWILNRKVSHYRELVCDEKAISQTGLSPVHYSRYLLRIAESTNRKDDILQPGLAFTKSYAYLKRRISYLLDKKEPDFSVRPGKLDKFVVCGLLIALVPFSWFYQVNDASLICRESDKKPRYIVYNSLPEPVGGFGRIQHELQSVMQSSRIRVTGTVVVELSLDKHGDVVHAEVISSACGAEASALVAATAVTWRPRIKNGKAVPSKVRFPILLKAPNADS